MGQILPHCRQKSAVTASVMKKNKRTYSGDGRIALTKVGRHGRRRASLKLHRRRALCLVDLEREREEMSALGMIET